MGDLRRETPRRVVSARWLTLDAQRETTRGAGEHRLAQRAGQWRHQTVARWFIWIYVLLLLGEGALRKWIFPQLSSPLLIIRDPLVIAIYAVALAGGFFPRSGYVIALGIIALLASVAGFLAESFSLPVFLFGLRSNFLHLPLIFVIARVMTYEDVIRLGKWILLLSIPTAYLVVRQFAASPDDILNVGAGMG